MLRHVHGVAEVLCLVSTDEEPQWCATAPYQRTRLCLDEVQVPAFRSNEHVPEWKGWWALPQVKLGTHGRTFPAL
jgi:hypothetical protein